MLNKGPYGYYLRWGTRNISVPKDIQLDEWRLKTKE